MLRVNSNKRKRDIVDILSQQYALSAREISDRMNINVRSIDRYLHELVKERRVYKSYNIFQNGLGRPNYYYSLRIKK